MASMMRIGEAAGAAGVSAKAIRFWEAKGMVPGVERTRAGYRLFGEDALDVLRFIRRAQGLGLTLDEISGLLELQRGGTAPCARVTQMLDERLEDIDRRIGELQRLRQTLLATRQCANAWDGDPVDYATVCPIIEQRT